MAASEHLSKDQFHDYAPRMSEQTHRTAALAGARHFGSEGVQVNQAAMPKGDPHEGRTAVVHEITGRHPHGWNILGRSAVVTVHHDGSHTLEPDED